MKRHLLIFAHICLVAFLTNCKKKSIEYLYPDKPQSTTTQNVSNDDLASFFKSKANKSETFVVNASTGGTFTSTKGISYTIDPGIFIKPNGQTVTGNIEVTVKEVTEPSEMILNDMPTNAIENPRDTVVPKDTLRANVGRMLESFGEIKVDAKQGAEDLQLKPNAEIEVKIPQPALPEPIIITESYPIWSTVKKIQSVFGHDHENRPTSVETLADNQVQTGVEWRQYPYFAQVEQTVVNNVPVTSLNFVVDRMGEWRNCDVLVPVTTTTTVLGFFQNVYNDSANSDQYGGMQPNMLFFKKKGDNVLIKLYNHILNAPVGKKGLLSYQNSFGIGMEGTFLALVKKEGKCYAQKKAVTIGTPESGKTYFGVNFTLEEVSEDQMLSLIRSMSEE
jgi:hypothetical protein